MDSFPLSPRPLPSLVRLETRTGKCDGEGDDGSQDLEGRDGQWCSVDLDREGLFEVNVVLYIYFYQTGLWVACGLFWPGEEMVNGTVGLFWLDWTAKRVLFLPNETVLGGQNRSCFGSPQVKAVKS